MKLRSNRISFLLIVPFMLAFLAGCDVGDDIPAYEEKKSALSSPSNITATAGDKDGALVLGWNEVPGATGYNINYSSSNDNKPINITGVRGTSYSFSTLESDLTYFFSVLAFNESGSSPISATYEYRLKKVSKLPEAPTNLVATAGSANGSLTLSWDAVANATSYTIKRVPENSGGGSKTDTGITATTFDFTNLDTGINYAFTVTAVNGSGSSAESTVSHQLAPITVAKPSAPTNLVATAGSANGSLTLSWDAVANATSYSIKRTPTSSTDAAEKLETGITETKFDFTGLDTGVTYKITVTAVNGSGSSAESTVSHQLAPIAVAKPSAPTNLAATAGSADGSLTLSWDAVANATSYSIKRTPTSSTDAAEKLETGITETKFDFTGLDTGVTYKITVTAVNGSGSSAESTVSHQLAPIAVAKPSAPTNLAATAGSADGSLTLSWDAVANATSYSIKRTPTSSTDAAEKLETGITETKFDFTGLDTGVTYKFTVTAINGSGSSAESTVSHQLAPIAVAKPNAPTNLVATAGSANGSLTLSWDAVANATSYTIKRTPENSNGGVKTEAGITATTFDFTNLDTGVNYVFTVTAVNGSGSSAESSTVSHQLAPIAVAKPNAPTNLVATAGSADGSLTLSWDAVADATSYSIKRTPTSSTNVAEKLETGITETKFDFTALDTGVTYKFTVTAINGSGSSAESTVSHQLAPIAVAKPNAPTNLAATAGSTNGSLTLSWDAVADATSYSIKRTPTSSTNAAEKLETGITETKFDFTALDTGVNGVSYTFAVTAVNGSGSSAESTVSHQLTPVIVTPTLSTPTNLAATAGSADGSLTLSWDAVADATSYSIKRTPTSSTDAAEKLETGITETKFDFTGLDTGVTYKFTVTAVKGSDSSAESSQISHLLNKVPVFSISSSTFTDGGDIPTKMAESSHGGTSTSPQISWSNLPVGTKALAIVFDDETSPCGAGTAACKHWSQILVLKGETSIAEGAGVDYTGPYPPFTHTYTLEVFALNTDAITLTGKVNRAEFKNAHGNAVIGSDSMTGVFKLGGFPSFP